VYVAILVEELLLLEEEDWGRGMLELEVERVMLSKEVERSGVGGGKM
jgi:hypothetical protein